MTQPSRGMSPSEAWAALSEGNARFVRGEMAHPSQDAGQRARIAAAQYPFAVIFGCSDSRVAAEIIFDQGLGDVFVVRTAGHVVDTSVLGSIEYGVEVLGAALVVVLGHAECGAVAAANHAPVTGERPSGFVRAIVDRVIPSIVGPDGREGSGAPEPPVVLREHVRNTVHMLHSYSAALAAAVADGRCAVIGAEYALAEGDVSVVETLGQV